MITIAIITLVVIVAVSAGVAAGVSRGRTTNIPVPAPELPKEPPKLKKPEPSEEVKRALAMPKYITVKAGQEEWYEKAMCGNCGRIAHEWCQDRWSKKSNGCCYDDNEREIKWFSDIRENDDACKLWKGTRKRVIRGETCRYYSSRYDYRGHGQSVELDIKCTNSERPDSVNNQEKERTRVMIEMGWSRPAGPPILHDPSCQGPKCGYWEPKQKRI